MAEPATTRNPGTALRLALAEARAARDRSAALVSGLDRTIAALEQVVEGSVQQHLETLPEPPAPPPLTSPEAHRAAHRPGHPARLDSDADLRAFVMARLGHQTFDQIAAAVADTFPPERRVRKSALHAWWQKQAHHS